jgi:predicted RecA/RadA family phage recombinase
MKNFIQEGAVMTFVAPGSVTSGVPLMIGDILAVPTVNASVGESFAALVVGVISYTKAGSQAWAQGESIYWNGTVFTTDAGGGSNPLVGTAAESIGSGAGETTGKVRLDGVARP